MNKQAYEHVVGAVLNKQAYDWSKLLEDAKGVGQKAWEGLKDSYQKNPEMYHKGIIGALAGAGLGGAWKGWKGALAGAGIGGASAVGVPKLYEYLKDYLDKYQEQKRIDSLPNTGGYQIPDTPINVGKQIPVNSGMEEFKKLVSKHSNK